MYERHEAPPVALMSLMSQKLTELTPDASLKVACVLGVELLSVIRFPLVPDTPNALTVVVVLAGNVIVAGWTVLVMLVNVLAPVMVSAPEPPWFSVGHVLPPPANVLALALVILIAPVPVTVKFVDVAQFHAVPEPETAHVPEPTFNVRAVVPEESNEPQVTFLPLAFSVPLGIVKARAAAIVRLSDSA